MLRWPYADLGLPYAVDALWEMPTLPPSAEAEGCRDVGFEASRDVDAAIPRAVMLLTPFGMGRDVVGAGIFRRMGSPAASTSVFRCFEAGSGTGKVSILHGSYCRKVGALQPEGLCLLDAGGSIALRAFMPDSCNSPSARCCGGGEAT